MIRSEWALVFSTEMRRYGDCNGNKLRTGGVTVLARLGLKLNFDLLCVFNLIVTTIFKSKHFCGHQLCLTESIFYIVHSNALIAIRCIMWCVFDNETDNFCFILVCTHFIVDMISDLKLVLTNM